jgi:hypothetical protein
MIDNKFVPMQHGQPVNPQFSYSSDHVRDPIEWDRRRKLIIGVDQGLYAAAVFAPAHRMGQLRTLRERVFMREDGKSLMKLGPTAFGKACRPDARRPFPRRHPDDVRVRCDPAAFAAGDREDNEHDWVLAFRRRSGLKVRKAKSNRQQLRLEAIWRRWRARRLCGRPSCKHLIRAHLGGYHYRKAEISDGEIKRGHLEIADTIFTHVATPSNMRARGRARDRRHPRAHGAGGRTITNDSDYAILGGSLKAFKGSATKLRNELTIVKRDLSPEARPFGAPKPAKSDEQAAERAAALAAAFAADTTELVFSDGRREIRELAPLVITGDAWRDTPNGRVLNAELDLEPGDCQRETMELRGFGLLDEAGEQVGYCALPDAIVIGRNQHFRLPLNTVRF